MKKTLAAFAILLSLIVSACASRKATSSPSNLMPGSSDAKVAAATPNSEISGPEVSTTMPEVGSGDAPPVSESTSASVIALEDNGKTFTFQVGDSFLLNLGAGYDWTVAVDNQDAVALKMGVMVIEGAQGVFDALAPGTATLQAVGEPGCLKSTPPCKIPTILFKVILTVE